MTEVVERLNPTVATRRRLFALSRNQCAFPRCSNCIIDSDGTLLADICHIEGAKEGSERFNKRQSNEQRRAFENLILFCRTHHAQTNNVERYTVKVLQQMKAEHERLAFDSPVDIASESRFLDRSLEQFYEEPLNFAQLDLDRCEDDFFVEARRMLQCIADLPQATRSLYANALNRAIYVRDLAFCINPFELTQRLQIPRSLLDEHFAILEQQKLIIGWEEDEGKNELNIRGTRYYLRGLDFHDNGIYFVYLIKQRFVQEPQGILELIENLNFRLLDT